MIILVLYDELDDITGIPTGKRLVSHGVDPETLECITMPNVEPDGVGWYNNDLQEWVMNS